MSKGKYVPVGLKPYKPFFLLICLSLYLFVTYLSTHLYIFMGGPLDPLHSGYILSVNQCQIFYVR